MRVIIEGREIEGTVEEVAELLRLLDLPKKSGETRSQRAISSPSGNSPFVSEEVAYDILTRRPLAGSYVTVLKKLNDAGEEWTSALQLQNALDFSTREFAGLLGAFGRRISHTPGAGSRAFFDQYWDHEHGYNLYRLPPAVRAALKRADLV